MSKLAEELGLLPLPVSLRALGGDGPRPGRDWTLWGTAASLGAVAAAWAELPRAEAPLPAHTLCLAPAGTPPETCRLEPPEHAEGYALRLEASAATLAGKDAAGLFYAVQTLAQIFRAAPAPPALEIRDHPHTAWRGFQIDLARQMEGFDTICRYVDSLAARKLNQCYLYLENAFAYSAIPDAVADRALTPAQVRTLEAFCRARYVELIPSANFLGHNENLLSHPAYAHLSETREGSTYRPHMESVSELCPSLPETWELLESMIEDLSAAFTSPLLHVGLDEVWSLGTCPLCAPVRESLGEGELLRRHAERLHGLCAARGRRMMMWADMLFYWPEIISGLPSDIVMVDWYYEKVVDRLRINYLNYAKLDTTGLLRDSGFEVLMAPGVDPTNCLELTRYGRQHGALGICATQWEMSDVLLEEQTAGIVYAADCAWSTVLTPPAEALPRLAQNVLGSRDPAALALLGLTTQRGYGGGEGGGPARHLRYRREAVDTSGLMRWTQARQACTAAQASPAAQVEPAAGLLRRIALSVNRDLAGARGQVTVNEAALAARVACAGSGEDQRPDLARYAEEMSAVAALRRENAAEMRLLWAEDRPDIEPRHDVLARMEREAEATAAWAEALAIFAADPAPGKAPFDRLRVVVEVMEPEANVQRLTLEASADGREWTEIALSAGPHAGPLDTGTALDFSTAGDVPRGTRFVRLSSPGVSPLGIRTVRLLDPAQDRRPSGVVETGGPVWFAEHLLADDARVCLLNEASVAQAFYHPESLERSWVTLAFPPADG